MLRNLIRFLFVVLALALARYLVVMLANAVAGPRRGGQNARRRPSPQPTSAVPTEGSLKKDPVCGMFIPEASSIKETVDGAVVHFCSAECRAKFQQSA